MALNDIIQYFNVIYIFIIVVIAQGILCISHKKLKLSWNWVSAFHGLDLGKSDDSAISDWASLE